MNNCLLNLIPPAKIKIVYNLYLLYFLKIISEVLLIYSVIVAITLILAQNFLTKNLQDHQTKTLTIEKEYKQFNQEISLANRDLEKIDLVQNNFLDWSGFLYNLTAAQNEGISLTGLELQKTSRKIILQGSAKTRQDLLEYQKNLEQHALVQNIQIPNSTLTAKENINFNLTGNWQAQ